MRAERGLLSKRNCWIGNTRNSWKERNVKGIEKAT